MTVLNKTIQTPQSGDWDHFWKKDSTEAFTQISWSKKRIMKILKPYAVSGKKALDAGCGSGFFSRYFCDAGMTTVSLDYSQGALDIAKRLTSGRTEILKHDLLSANLSAVNKKFDLIFTDGLLEHFPFEDQANILKNLSGVLSSDGVIVTVVPNRWSPWELIRPFFMPGIEETPFILKDLIHLHKHAGFDVIAQGGINTLPLAFSPDQIVGSTFGMLLYTICRKHG